MTKVSMTIDGVRYDDDVEPRMLLVHYLREVAGRTGTPVGCDTSNCGACTVLLNGLSAKSCSVLAVQADGAEITTIQGLANGEWHPLQRAFHEEHALQCGYCTPGMILASADLLRDNPNPTEQEVREGLEGNLCRCTGYQNIVRAVLRAAAGLGGVAPRGAPRGGLGGSPLRGARPRPARELRHDRHRDRQAPDPQGRHPAGHRADQLDRQHPAARAAVRGLPAQPDGARADQVSGRVRRPRGTRRRRRLLGRRLRRRAGQPALRLAGDPGHRDAGASADGHRGGPLRRRDRGLRGGPQPVRRRGRPGEDRRRLRTAAGRAGHGVRADRGLAEGARRGQQVLRVGLRQRRHGGGVPGRPGGTRADLPPAAPDPLRDGTARGGVRAGGRRVHALVGHPDPAHPALPAGRDHRHPGAEPAGGGAGRGRRIRVEAAGHRRRGAGRADRPQAPQAGEVVRVAQRGQPGRAPRPRPAAADPGGGGPGRPASAAWPWTCWPTWAPT